MPHGSCYCELCAHYICVGKRANATGMREAYSGESMKQFETVVNVVLLRNFEMVSSAIALRFLWTMDHYINFQ